MMDTPVLLPSSTPNIQTSLTHSSSPFINLPLEVQERSMRLLDRSSLLSLALTHKVINKNAQPTLFRHIDFFINARKVKSNHAQAQREARKYTDDLVLFAIKMLDTFERKEISGLGIEETVNGEEAETDTRYMERKRYGWVRSVKLVSHPEMNEANIFLLDSTSASLTALSIIAPYNHLVEGFNTRTKVYNSLLEAMLLRGFQAFHPQPLPDLADDSISSQDPHSPPEDDITDENSLELRLRPGRRRSSEYSGSNSGETAWGDTSIRPTDLNLSSLTQVTLGQNSIRFVEFLPLLFQIAQNITHLSADMSNENRLDPKWDFDTKFEVQTKLCYLFVRYTEYDRYTHEIKDSQSLHILLDLLTQSPKITTLSFDYAIDDTYDITGDLPEFEDMAMSRIAQLPELLELDWKVELNKKSYDRLRYINFFSLRKIRRLKVKYHQWTYPVKVGVPASLEELRLDCTDRQDSKHSPLPPVILLPSLPGALDVKFAIWLRNTPQLHTISYFSTENANKEYPQSRGESDDEVYWDSDDTDSEDELVTSGSTTSSEEEDAQPDSDPTPLLSNDESINHDDEISKQVSIHIFSFRYKTHEILHGRLYAHDIKMYQNYGRQTGSMLFCHAGEERADMYSIHPGSIIQQPPTGRYFGDWDGMVVPPGVLEEMRRNENLSIGEWEQRGVAVSGETWGLLCQWREGMMAAKKVYDEYLK